MAVQGAAKQALLCDNGGMSAKPIYLDHHATTPLDPEALEAMTPFLTGVCGNAASVNHRYGEEAARAIARAMPGVRLVLTGAAAMAGLGVAVGLVASYMLRRTVENMLYNVSPHDAPTYLAVGALLALVALIGLHQSPNLLGRRPIRQQAPEVGAEFFLLARKTELHRDPLPCDHKPESITRSPVGTTLPAANLLTAPQPQSTEHSRKARPPIVVAANPLDDIANLRSPRLVLKEGRVVSDKRHLSGKVPIA